MRGRGTTLAAALVAALTFAIAAPAGAQRCVLRLGACPTSGPAPTPTPTPKPPDPGGKESPDQPVPPPGKHFGFNNGYAPVSDSSSAESLFALGATHADVLRHPFTWIDFGAEVSASQPVPADFADPLGAAPPGSLTASRDSRYLDLTAHGITPIMPVMWVPVWASTLHRCTDAAYRIRHRAECPTGWEGNRRYFPAPEYYPQWRQFVAAVAKRYPLAIIEGPNEPYNAWNAHQKDPKTYPNAISPSVAADVQCQLYGAVKTAAPSSTVLSMAMHDAPYERTFIADAQSAKGQRCYDVLSYHEYPGLPPFGAGSRLARDMADVRAARSAAGDTTPIWITESGYSFVPAETDDPDAWEQTYADASRRLYNRFVTMPDIRAVVFNTLRDRSYEAYKDPTKEGYHYGFFYEDWTPKRRGCEFVRMARGTYPGCPFS